MVYLPDDCIVALLKNRDVHPRIQVLLLDLQLYHVRMEVGKSGWVYSQALLEQSDILCPGMEIMGPNKKTHTIKRPTKSNSRAGELPAVRAEVYFDGSC